MELECSNSNPGTAWIGLSKHCKVSIREKTLQNFIDHNKNNYFDIFKDVADYSPRSIFHWKIYRNFALVLSCRSICLTNQGSFINDVTHISDNLVPVSLAVDQEVWRNLVTFENLIWQNVASGGLWSPLKAPGRARALGLGLRAM